MPLPINEDLQGVSSPPIAAARAWLSESRRDLDLIDMGQAVPSDPPAEALRQRVAAFALQPESAFYTDILGRDDLRQAMAAALSADYGAAISAENVGISAGGNHAFCMALMALAGAGDEVLLGEPYYFNHEMWLSMQGIKMVGLPCRPGPEGMVPDPAEAEALITEKTRAIALVTPNNPTGTVYGAERLEAFFDLAARHDLALVLDETYKDFLPAGGRPHGLFDRPDWEEVLVQVTSFSKSYSLTGYRVGALTAGRRLMEAIGKVADTLTICPAHLGQEAALYGLENLDDWRNAFRDRMAKRAETLAAAFARRRPAFELLSSGAFFAYLRHPFNGEGSEAVARRLVREQALFLLPGAFFGAGQERYLRAAFANVSEDGIEEAVRRLAELVPGG